MCVCLHRAITALLQLYSHVRVLEGLARRVQRESGGGFDGRVGEVQLQGFTFT